MPLATQGFGVGKAIEEPTVTNMYIQKDNDGTWRADGLSFSPWTDVTNIQVKFDVATGSSPESVGIYVKKDSKHYLATVLTGNTYYVDFGTRLSEGTHGTTNSVELVAYAAKDGEGDTFTQRGNFAITYIDVEAVQHVYNLLDTDWESDNVAKPDIVIGGSDSADPYLNTDAIKIYQSPRNATRDFRMMSMSRISSEDYVVIDVHSTDTSTGARVKLNQLIKEVERILNNYRKIPGGGYTNLEYDSLTIRSEYFDHFRKTMEVTLRKTLKAVQT